MTAARVVSIVPTTQRICASPSSISSQTRASNWPVEILPTLSPNALSTPRPSRRTARAPTALPRCRPVRRSVRSRLGTRRWPPVRSRRCFRARPGAGRRRCRSPSLSSRHRDRHMLHGCPPQAADARLGRISDPVQASLEDSRLPVTPLRTRSPIAPSPPCLWTTRNAVGVAWRILADWVGLHLRRVREPRLRIGRKWTQHQRAGREA